MTAEKGPRIFGGILPYEAEVAEPNGPRVVAWVLADYADRMDAIFQKWLAEHDREVAARALNDAADALYTDEGPGHPLSTATWLRARASSDEEESDPEIMRAFQDQRLGRRHADYTELYTGNLQTPNNPER